MRNRIKKMATYKGFEVNVLHEESGYYFVWAFTNHPMPMDLLIEMKKEGRLEYSGKISVSDTELSFLE